MASRRGCVNSLWSGNERVRIMERLKATLAGILELEVLRRKQLEVVDAALDDRVRHATEEATAGGRESGTSESVAVDTEHGSATSRRQQAPSPSFMLVLPCQSSPDDCSATQVEGASHSSGRGSNSRWSTLSWDAPSDLVSSPTPDSSGMVNLESDSRPSSGFYSVSGSSLSDSSYSVSSDATQGGSAPAARPSKLWEQVPPSVDNNDILWSEGAVLQPQAILPRKQEVSEPEGTPVSVQSDPESAGLSFLSDRKLRLSDSLISSLLPLLDPTSSSSTYALGQKPQLDPRYCTDLMSRRTKEVYSYPSPLHAVALQSPLFTLQSQEQSGSLNPEGPKQDEMQEASAEQILPFQSPQAPVMASFTQLEQYISRLARQYHSRVTSSTSDLTLGATPGPITQRGLSTITHRGLCTPGKSHGSTQSLSAFENRSTLSVTPSKSLMGNSARVSLSSTGKKVTRNSINLGNLPSATGEDVNINLHLNLNLKLTPGLHSSQGLVENPKNGSCGALRSESAAAISTASATSLSSATSTPALRTRPRISTCPSNLSHRSSLEVTSGSGSSCGFGSSTFSRSLDWSSCASPEIGQSAVGTNFGSAPDAQSSELIKETNLSPKISEDSPMVGEISRLSGLSRAVVVGLMEQGVELDIDCFKNDSTGEVRSHGKTHMIAQTDRSHDYTKLTESNPQRPIQLSLSVTHSPKSQSSLTPPHSHSSSPIHPFQSIHIPSPHYSSHCHYQQISSPSNPPSSTASSPAYHPISRGRSPPRPLQPSSVGDTPLSVFRRDAPFQCSMPCSNTRNSPLDCGIQPRGGSLRMSKGQSGGWKRVEGEGLYRGKHTSHKLIRAATVSSYAKKEDYSSIWDEEHEKSTTQTPKKINKLWRGFEEHLWSKESESEREDIGKVQYGHSWRGNNIGSWKKDHRRLKASSSSNDKRPKVDSPMFSKKRGKEEGERRSTSLRISRRALFRSESQGLLVPHNHSREPAKRTHWVSSLDVGQGDMYINKDEGVRLLSTKKEDKQLSSTASLFNLSCSQSLEGSCHSLSPLSSSSFSPSPPPRMPLQRSLSLRDLGRRVFGSMRSLSLKRKPSKK
ncbi:uncharacterized protein si:ch211-168f7.5 [Antennarius striatus]|uniref:uncharacterized protein si:ch211-168f7.5 n=1 Tax=Antennarius striatus TaxID=241820 RepID=UPI0035B0F7E0